MVLLLLPDRVIFEREVISIEMSQLPLPPHICCCSSSVGALQTSISDADAVDVAQMPRLSKVAAATADDVVPDDANVVPDDDGGVVHTKYASRRIR